MTGKMTLTIASDQEREDVFAEIYDGNEQWAEVVTDPDGELTIEIFAPKNGASYRFSLEAVQLVLDEAKTKLMAPRYSRETPALSQASTIQR